MTFLLAAVLMASSVVTTNAEVVKQTGKAVTLEGTLERRSMGKGGSGWNGTALVLDDGTEVWLSYREPPASLEGLVGARLQLPGTLARELEPNAQALLAPHLVKLGAPVKVAKVLKAGATGWVRGDAGNAKGGAILMVNDLPLSVRGRVGWKPEEEGTRVSLHGSLSFEQFLPQATVGPKGEISQGADGSQWVLTPSKPK